MKSLSSLPLLLSTAAVLFLAALSACGGGSSDDAVSTAPASAVIGPAGGTVNGPNGSSVVIPPGALAAETTIGIEATQAGAPARPAHLSASGATFAFTPHGTTFALPVTVTLPFDAAAASASVTPALYKTNAAGRWERVVNASFDGERVTATITGFSHAGVILLPLQRSDPQRDWEFSVRTSQTGSIVPGPDGSGTQTGGLFEKVADFGPMPLDEEMFTFTGSIPEDGLASGLVFGNADGVTYGVFAEAPFGELGGINQPGDPQPIASHSRLDQRQSFIKRSADASLEFTITVVLVCGFDYNLFAPTFGTDDAHTQVRGDVSLEVQAWTKQSQRFLFSVSGMAGVTGTRNAWTPFVVNFANGISGELWNDGSFDFTSEVIGEPIVVGGGPDQLGVGSEGCIELKGGGTLTHVIDLSSVAVGEEFTLRSVAEADAENRRGGGAIGDHQASGVNAYLRDPLRIGGTTLTFIGLEPTNAPDAAPPAQVPVVPASCVPGPAPDPAAGLLHFSAASYTIAESAAALQTVVVARSGGASGAVSATVATSDGTAIAGTDYTPVHITVFFADGDAAPRTVVVPIIGNVVDAPDKKVNLALSQPGGCAALGEQTTALLTIEDDDGAATSTVSGVLDPSFGIGGEATANAFGGDRSGMALQADGKIVMVGGTAVDFVLARFNADGSLDAGFGVGGKVTTDMGGGISGEEARAVAIQADGRIVVVGHVTVPRTPPAPAQPPNFALARYNADGGLDASFGAGGKVTSGVVGNAFAVAIQADGKIVVAGDFNLPAPVGSDFSDFALARYNANGSLDASFGSGGQLTTDLAGGANHGANIVMQPDGAIVVSGKPVGNFAGSDHTDIARYSANGTLDAGFGIGGKLTLAGVEASEGLVRQPDGKLVLVGSVVQSAAPATSRFLLLRRNADGSADTGFGNGGQVDAPLGENATAEGVALQADGKLVVVGTRAFASNQNFIVARYAPSGALDTGFGTGGMLSIDFFGFSDIGENVLVQADGKLLVGGLARNNIDGYGLARIIP